MIGTVGCDGCAGVELLLVEDEETELHHEIPDDGQPHVARLDCPCRPRLEWLDHGLATVAHVKANTGDLAG